MSIYTYLKAYMVEFSMIATESDIELQNHIILNFDTKFRFGIDMVKIEHIVSENEIRNYYIPKNPG